MIGTDRYRYIIYIHMLFEKVFQIRTRNGIFGYLNTSTDIF